MTRRERLENKLQKRLDWAEKREVRAASSFDRAHTIGDRIPFGQPILVGHHSEAHHRRDLARIDSAMRQGVESSQMAQHHSSKAQGIERQLDRSVFSDDPDALEALEARIAENEAKRETMRRVNALYRKGDAAGLEAMGLNLETLRQKVASLEAWQDQQPFPKYALSNLGGRIQADKKRLEAIKAQQARQQQAQASPNGVVVEGGGEYIRVTFAEKPARTILDALKAAGFSWGAGSWVGRRDKLPAEVGGADND